MLQRDTILYILLKKGSNKRKCPSDSCTETTSEILHTVLIFRTTPCQRSAGVTIEESCRRISWAAVTWGRYWHGGV